MIRVLLQFVTSSLAVIGLLMAVCVLPVMVDGELSAGILALLAPLTKASPIGSRFTAQMRIVWPFSPSSGSSKGTFLIALLRSIRPLYHRREPRRDRHEL